MERRSRKFSSVLRLLSLLLCFVFSGAMSFGDDTSASAPLTSLKESLSSTSSESQSLNATLRTRWDDLETRLGMLLEEANQSSMDWDVLLTELEQLRIEVEQLRLASKKSSESFESYVQSTNKQIASIEAIHSLEILKLRREKERLEFWNKVGLAGSVSGWLAFFLVLLIQSIGR
jgi:chromosome segregation ATPase